MLTKAMKRGLWIGCGGGLGAIIGVYCGMGAYFSNHFYYKTKVNGESVGGKTAKEVENMLLKGAESYTLELQKRQGEKEVMTAKEIGFTYNIGEQVALLKEEQGAFSWLGKVWGPKELEVELEPVYDAKMLEDAFRELECMQPEQNIAPVDAELVFDRTHYKIQEEQTGSLIKQDKLYALIEDAVAEEMQTLNLEETRCYEEPSYTTQSKELIEQRDRLNQYLSTKIDYQFGDRIHTLDGATINEWMIVDEQNEITLDEEAIREYVRGLAVEYDTLYSVRKFTTTEGNEVTVVGGDYGWRMNQLEETKALIDLIMAGNQKVDRTPVYEQEAWCRDANDIGNDYVEINLSKQYLWLYIDGELVTEGSIVSGTETNQYITPSGTYRIDYMQRNATLRGPGYVTPVSFWIPFNSGIGIHDATWRGSFGGSIYMYSGSHGCINCPYDLAEKIYAYVKSGMPVVCYRE